jgi:hypothetical protein
MLTIAVIAAVGGVGSAAGGWAFSQVLHLHRRVKKLENHVAALERS